MIDKIKKIAGYILAGLKILLAALGVIKDKTKTKIDDKAHDIISDVVEGAEKLGLDKKDEE